MEKGRWSYFEEKNLFHIFHEKGIIHAVVNININYKKSAKVGEYMELGSQTESDFIMML
jgi:acyl-CoA thioesterase FadM